MTMSGADANNKSILITVANEAAGHLNAASGGGSRGGTKPEDGKSDKDKKEEKNQSTSLKKLIGIDISLAAMLKQSQIFTGFLGSVFQLIGMLVDVILAPLAPYLFRLVEIVASWIPKIAGWSEAAVQWTKDSLDKLAELVTLQTGVSVSASDLVKKGFQLISLSGLGALIGSSFAAKVGSIGEWKVKDFFKGVFTEDDVLNPIKNSLKDTGKLLSGFKSLFKALMGEAIWGMGVKLLGITRTVLRALGIVGLILGIVITVAEFKQAWDDGDIGGALVLLAIQIVVIGVPLLVGLFFGGWVALVAAIAISALAMWYEAGVKEETKNKIEGHVARFYKEMTDSVDDFFGEEGGFQHWLVTISMFFGGQFNPALWSGITLTEGVKQTINEGVRSMLDGIVNGFIDMINGLVTNVLQPIVDSSFGKALMAGYRASGADIPGWAKDDWELIPHKDFSQYNFILGASTPAQNDERRNLMNPHGDANLQPGGGG